MRRKIFTLLFALALIAPVVAQQEQQRPQWMIPGIPEKPGRLDYIREYTRAMRALVAAGGEDPDAVRQQIVRQQVDKFGAYVMFLTNWDDAKIEQNRFLLDPLLEEAKKIRGPADRR